MRAKQPWRHPPVALSLLVLVSHRRSAVIKEPSDDAEMTKLPVGLLSWVLEHHRKMNTPGLSVQAVDLPSLEVRTFQTHPSQVLAVLSL